MQLVSVSPALDRRAFETSPSLPRSDRDGFLHGADAFDARMGADARSGRLLAADDVVTRMRDRGCEQPLSRLARWIVGRDVVSVEWHGHTWLPLFQFEPARMSLRAGVSAVVHELAGAFDEREIMEWFTTPNSCLRDMAPSDLVSIRPVLVLNAARLDRFIACG